jgi:hypothetical protein
MSSATFNVTKVIPQIIRVELREEGATITFDNGTTFFLSQEQVAKVWGMMTLALDCAVLGELSSKIRRLGINAVIMNALKGIKSIQDDENQDQLAFLNG